MRRPNSPVGARQRGMALIAALLLLVVVTIMAISMFRSYGMQEKIAGNTREKQRALNAAVSAQQFAETWLASGTAPASAACSGVVSSTVGQVCTNLPNDLLGDVSQLPWANGGVTYTPFTSNLIDGKTIQIIDPDTGGTPQRDSYAAAPIFYITDMGPAGPTSGLNGEIYQIDAVGYGGTSNAVAVVESTYLISTNTATGHDK